MHGGGHWARVLQEGLRQVQHRDPARVTSRQHSGMASVNGNIIEVSSISISISLLVRDVPDCTVSPVLLKWGLLFWIFFKT